jgi:hypothetical protein
MKLLDILAVLMFCLLVGRCDAQVNLAAAGANSGTIVDVVVWSGSPEADITLAADNGGSPTTLFGSDSDDWLYCGALFLALGAIAIDFSHNDGIQDPGPTPSVVSEIPGSWVLGFVLFAGYCSAIWRKRRLCDKMAKRRAVMQLRDAPKFRISSRLLQVLTVSTQRSFLC